MARPKCIMCGAELDWSAMMSSCFLTGGQRCGSEDCHTKAMEYSGKRDAILKQYTEEKLRVLFPIKERQDTDIFLLEQEYLKGKKATE